MTPLLPHDVEQEDFSLILPKDRQRLFVARRGPVAFGETAPVHTHGPADHMDPGAASRPQRHHSYVARLDAGHPQVHVLAQRQALAATASGGEESEVAASLRPAEGADLAGTVLVGEYGGEHVGKGVPVAVRVPRPFGAMDADHAFASGLACRMSPSRATGVPRAQVIDSSDETWLGAGRGPGRRTVFGRARSDGVRNSDAVAAAVRGMEWGAAYRVASRTSRTTDSRVYFFIF